jgi:hypothetical protein
MSINSEPFSTDEFDSVLVGKSGLDKTPQQVKLERAIDAEYEELSSERPFVDNVESSVGTDELEVPGISYSEYEGAVDRAALAPDNSKLEVKKSFNQLYKALNEKYGLNLSTDSSSFSDMLSSIVDPKMKQALQLYISESYDRFRVMIYNNYLNAIAALSQQILDPSYILSESISYSDKLKLMKDLFMMLQQIETIYQAVSIKDADTKLAHLSDTDMNNSNINDKETRELLKQLLNKDK